MFNFKALFILLFLPAICLSNSDLRWLGYAMGEQISNMHGGLHTGTIYTEALRLTAVYDASKSLWRGSEFSLGVLAIGQTHKQYSYTAAIQPPSGFSGVPEIRITDLALAQTFDKYFSMRVGIMDFDDYFNLVEVALPLMNSALTNTATMNFNTQLATYPYPGFGAFAKMGSEKLFVLAGIFQGNPQHQGTLWQRGQLVIAEMDYFFDYKDAECIVKGALWDYNQPLEYIGTTTKGIYAIAEMSKNMQGYTISSAINVGINPKKYNTVTHSVAACLLFGGIIPTRANDSLNFAIGRAWLEGAQHPETYYEVGYTIKLIKDLYFTPDIQYFTHPDGQYPNAWVAILRLLYSAPLTR